MSPVHDAMVVGGGPAGVAAAIRLRQRGRSVVLVEQEAAPVFKVGEGLIPAARRVLSALGLRPGFLDDAHLHSMGNAAAWGTPALQAMDFIRSPDGHGWHLDRAAFEATLLAEAAQAGVQLRLGERAEAFARTAAGWRVTLAGEGAPSDVQVRWLVDASGRKHHVARRLGQPRHYLDQQLAMYVRLAPRLSGDADSLSLVESAAEGWWYTARLPDGQRIAVYFAAAGSAGAKAAQTLEGWLGLLLQTTHVADRLAGHHYVPRHAPIATDARSGRLPRFGGDGWLAAGDAAMAFDPLSSQGIYTALYAGMQAGDAVAGQLAGDADAPSRYAADLENVWAAYLAHRAAAYAALRAGRQKAPPGE